MLALLGLLVGLFFPRMPDMKVTSIKLQQLSPGELPFEIRPSKIDRNMPVIDFGFSMKMVLNLTVTNSNYYHLKMDDIMINIFMVSNATMINNAIPGPLENLGLNAEKTRIPVTQSNYRNQIGIGRYKNGIIFPRNEPIKFQIPLLRSANQVWV